MGRQIDPNILSDVIHRVTQSKKILDVGGAWEAYEGATHVLDIEPKPVGRDVEWIQGDACRPPTWDRFEDNEFDFAVCSHTIEDVYDPFTILEGLSRVAKCGYIEVPNAFAETMHFAKEFPYEFNGYIHHHFIFEPTYPGDDLMNDYFISPDWQEKGQIKVCPDDDFFLIATQKRPEILIPRLTKMEGQPGDWRRLSYFGIFWADKITAVLRGGPIDDTVEYFKNKRKKWESERAMMTYSPIIFQYRFIEQFKHRLPREGRLQ